VTCSTVRSYGGKPLENGGAYKKRTAIANSPIIRVMLGLT
jgi:hypothetical protein